MGKILLIKHELCFSCMEIHDVRLVEVETTNIFKGIEIKYLTKHFFCDRTEEFFSDEELLGANDRAMRDAYRIAKGLLTSEEIISSRQKADRSETDEKF